MPRMNKQPRLKKQIVSILEGYTGYRPLSTKQIMDLMAQHFNTYSKVPSINKVAEVLRQNNEFVRINPYDYPAKWRLKE